MPHFPSLRACQLKRLFEGRYGDELPNNSKGRKYALIMVHHLAAVNNPVKAITKWLKQCAPWMKPSEVADLTKVKPRRYSAIRLGKLLHLTYNERMMYGLNTARAVDCQDKREQTRRRVARKVETQRLKRRAQGVRPRAEYLASVRKKGSVPTDISLKGNDPKISLSGDSNPKPEKFNKGIPGPKFVFTLNMVSKLTKTGLILMESYKPQQHRKKGNDDKGNWWKFKKGKAKPQEEVGNCLYAKDQGWVIGQGLGGLPKYQPKE